MASALEAASNVFFKPTFVAAQSHLQTGAEGSSETSPLIPSPSPWGSAAPAGTSTEKHKA